MVYLNLEYETQKHIWKGVIVLPITKQATKVK